MTVVRGAAARRLAVRTHAQHLEPPQLRVPTTSTATAEADREDDATRIRLSSPVDGVLRLENRDHIQAPSSGAAPSADASPAESRPGHLGAVHWTLACSAHHLRVAGGLPPLQRKELSELLLLWYGVTDTGRVLDSVISVTAALGGTGSEGSLRLSASTGHLLVELSGPDTSPQAASDRAYAARVGGAHSAGRHHTFGEGRNRQVHWAAITLPARRSTPAGFATPAATPIAEPDDDWA